LDILKESAKSMATASIDEVSSFVGAECEALQSLSADVAHCVSSATDHMASGAKDIDAQTENTETLIASLEDVLISEMQNMMKQCFSHVVEQHKETSTKMKDAIESRALGMYSLSNSHSHWILIGFSLDPHWILILIGFLCVSCCVSGRASIYEWRDRKEVF
jgi:hypothetical protein